MENQNQTLIWVIVIIAIIFFLFSGFGYGGYSGMMGMMYGSYGSGMMFFGWLYGILILVALVLLIMWLAKQIQKK